MSQYLTQTSVLVESTSIQYLLLTFLLFPLVTEPGLGQGGGRDTASEEEGGHWEGQSKPISKRCSPCKMLQREESEQVHWWEDACAGPALGLWERKAVRGVMNAELGK